MKNPLIVLEFAASSGLDDALARATRSQQLLGAWDGGDEGALGRLIPLVQPELHRLAHH